MSLFETFLVWLGYQYEQLRQRVPVLWRPYCWLKGHRRKFSSFECLRCGKGLR